jgi:hypothetical protein
MRGAFQFLVALLAQSEFLDNSLIAVCSRTFEVIEQAAARGHHLQESTPGGMILGVHFEMLSQFGDPFGQQRDLNVCAASIFFVKSESVDFGCFCFSHFLRYLELASLPLLMEFGKGLSGSVV